MKPVVFHPEAEAELEAGADFHETRRAGLGLAFQDEVESLVRPVRTDPQRWPSYRGNRHQKCLLKRFPYNLVYLDLEDAIWIVAVAHQKRKPGYWSDREPEL